MVIKKHHLRHIRVFSGSLILYQLIIKKSIISYAFTKKEYFYTICHKYLYLGIDISWTCWYTLDKSFPNGY